MTNNLVVLPNTSNTCLANNGTHISLGSARLGELMGGTGDFGAAEDNFKGLELCAKSGTAEVGKDQKPHSWFIGFLDREDCPLAFVVVIENGGSGSKVAGSVAGKVLQSAVQRVTED